jgi:hypothetical protein
MSHRYILLLYQKSLSVSKNTAERGLLGIDLLMKATLPFMLELLMR